jgi:hypothetical protein
VVFRGLSRLSAPESGRVQLRDGLLRRSLPNDGGRSAAITVDWLVRFFGSITRLVGHRPPTPEKSGDSGLKRSWQRRPLVDNRLSFRLCLNDRDAHDPWNVRDLVDE